MNRWKNAKLEDLWALADAADTHALDEHKCSPNGYMRHAIDVLRASCPPPRTKAEVAAEALALLREHAVTGYGTIGDKLRALAKEPTSD